MNTNAARQEKYLGMKAPLPHILKEISQVGVIINCFIKRRPAQSLGQRAGQGAFAHPHISSNSDKMMVPHYLLLPSKIDYAHYFLK
jgi:hypothetical protein